MTTDPKTALFQAILAMDSYNRGYFEGVKIVDGADVEGSKLGAATIIRQADFENGSLGVDKGFYAVAYQYIDADNKTQTVISYRGTDQFLTANGVGGDIINSYAIGAGIADTSQTRLAIQFYKSVAEELGQDPYKASISVTGHSAGGGLAGLIGSIYQKSGVVFDNRAFQAAENDNGCCEGIPMYSLRKSKKSGICRIFLLGNYDAKRLWFGQAFNLCRGSKRLMRSFGFILNLYGYLKRSGLC